MPPFLGSFAPACTVGFEPKSDEWRERVLSNAAGRVIRYADLLNNGWNTRNLVAVDAGLVDKILINLDALRLSDGGPPQSRGSK